jgi:hypothetical protein
MKWDIDETLPQEQNTSVLDDEPPLKFTPVTLFLGLQYYSISISICNIFNQGLRNRLNDVEWLDVSE